jgi:aminopeptidase-like protein
VKPSALADSFAKCLGVVAVIEGNRKYLNLNPKCEPQLGMRGLYQTIGGQADARDFELAMLWVLNLSDTTHSLLDIAERSGIEFSLVRKAADALIEHALLQEIPANR